ncbi:hypothetical protein J3F84DRAFT_361930 [Trichoderma pleuroticola]
MSRHFFYVAYAISHLKLFEFPSIQRSFSLLTPPPLSPFSSPRFCVSTPAFQSARRARRRNVTTPDRWDGRGVFLSLFPLLPT